MLVPTPDIIAFIIFIALAFDFTNGFHDSANSISTVISTKVLSPQKAVVFAAFFNFIAAFFFGVAVASTISKIINLNYVDPMIVPVYHPCRSFRGDRLEPDHLVFRSPHFFFPCPDRCPCRSRNLGSGFSRNKTRNNRHRYPLHGALPDYRVYPRLLLHGMCALDRKRCPAYGR